MRFVLLFELYDSKMVLSNIGVFSSTSNVLCSVYKCFTFLFQPHSQPTSGLDSFSALKVVNVLHTIVQTQGASVLMTIHQPASDILAQIDRLVLLRAGRCMYHGLEDNVTEYFAARNYPIPPKYNPADWIMNVAQTVSEKELETLGYFEGLDEESLLGQTNARAASHEVDSAPSDFRRSSISTQIYWLMKRDLLSIKRNKKVLGSRLMLTTFMSVLTALIFLEVGDKDRSNPTVSVNSMIIILQQ